MIEALVDTLLELSSFFEKGGPYAVIAVFFTLFMLEQRKVRQKDAQILSLAIASVRAQGNATESLNNMQRLLEIELDDAKPEEEDDVEEVPD